MTLNHVLSEFMEEIKITCEGADSLELQDLQILQGDLKTLTQENYNKLSTRIIKRGFSFPFFVWKNNDINWILDGTHRKLVLTKMKGEGYSIPPLPVAWIEARDLQEAKAKLLECTSSYAEITTDGLNEFISDMPDFLDIVENIKLPDFDIGEFIASNVEVEVLPTGDPDEVPELKEDPITKRGDVWLLGRHRLKCGDSTMIDDVEDLMNGKKADMVFTDPPYNVNYTSKHTGKILNDNMSDEDFEQFIRDVYTQIDLATAKDSSIYICHATMIIAFDTVLREMDWEINNKIIWAKDIPTFTMARYKWKYEPIHFCLKGKPKFYGDKTQTNLWEIKSIQSAGNTWFKGGSKNLTLHPTQKPFQLPLKAIENSSQAGELLFEPFTGSGSTLIACEKSGRKCYGLELDEKYCDVAINRYINFTGRDDVTLESTGEKYNELKAARDGQT